MVNVDLGVFLMSSSSEEDNPIEPTLTDEGEENDENFDELQDEIALGGTPAGQAANELLRAL